MVRYVFIVRRDQPHLLEHLRREFAKEKEVEVLQDRRIGERRQRVQAWPAERRRADRRRMPGGRDALRSIGFDASLPVLVVETRTRPPSPSPDVAL